MAIAVQIDGHDLVMPIIGSALRLCQELARSRQLLYQKGGLVIEGCQPPRLPNRRDYSGQLGSTFRVRPGSAPFLIETSPRFSGYGAHAVGRSFAELQRGIEIAHLVPAKATQPPKAAAAVIAIAGNLFRLVRSAASRPIFDPERCIDPGRLPRESVAIWGRGGTP